MSRVTKHALADSLKKLLNKRSFDKITVKDIVEDCGVNRQTFYYHFHDIYDLMEWAIQDETERLHQQSLDYEDWTMGLRTILQFLRDNRVLVLNAYHSISHEVVANYITKTLRPYCAAVVQRQAQEMKDPADRADVDFVIEFLTMGTSGFVMQWLGNQMQMGDATLQSVDRLKLAMNGTVQLMLRNLRGQPE